MKKYATLIMAGLILSCILGLAGASDDERRDDRKKFYGTVEMIPKGRYGTWIVNGQPVLVTPQTKIEEEYGRAELGSNVEIEGRIDGPTFRAYELEVTRGSDREDYADDDRNREDDRSSGYTSGENEFYGTIKSIPQGGLGTWVVDNREIFVSKKTRIENEYGPARVGTRVEVKGIYQNGTFHAHKIETKN